MALDAVLAWIVTFVGAVLGFVVAAIEAGALLFLSWLPDAESGSDAQLEGLWSAFAGANQYVPLDLAATLLAAWGVLYGAVALYKLWKAVPFV